MDARTVDTIVDSYISIWNETDAHAMRAKVDQVFTPDATYVDPTIVIKGTDAIKEYVAKAQPNFTGMLFSRETILNHHDAVHFSWEVGPQGGEAVVNGFDFVLLDGTKITHIYGFFNPN